MRGHSIVQMMGHINPKKYELSRASYQKYELSGASFKIYQLSLK